MAEASLLTDFLGGLALVTTIGQFLSGIFTIQKIRSQGTAGDISPFPFLVNTVGCALWLAYGQMRDDSMVINCNIIGTLINAIYVLIFIQYVPRKAEFVRQIIMACVSLAIVLGASTSSGDPNQGVENLGRICVLISIICCGSPLIGLKHVIRTKSTDSLPFPLIFSTFVVCLLWWLYGVLTEDTYTQITNLLGTAISLVQLSLFIIYPSTPASRKLTSPDRKDD